VLEINNITKQHGNQTTLRNVQLKIEEGEFFSLLGPSGCGKTTLLRLLAGTETASSGEVLFRGKRIDDLNPQERPFNMVFQSYALFPHLSIYDNIAFGLRIKSRKNKFSESEIDKKVEAMLAMVHLEKYAERMPGTLSGGQCQRVALARALVNEPKVLLLDEPLSALDAKMREVMQRDLRALQQKLGITFIFVTHDQEEALILSDRIAVMNQGRIEQVCHPREMYESPQSAYVARFIGSNNEIPGTLVEDTAAPFVTLQIETSGVQQRVRGQMQGGSLNQGQVMAFVRPEKIDIFKNGAATTEDLQWTQGVQKNRILGILTNLVFRGQFNDAHVDCGNLGVFKVIARLQNNLEIGDDVELVFAPVDTFVFAVNEIE